MSEKTEFLLPAEITPGIRDLLGQPNFWCGPIAHAYRAFGFDIPPKAEDEQAFVLFRFLPLAIKHGEDWRKFAQDDMRKARAAFKAAQETGHD